MYMEAKTVPTVNIINFGRLMGSIKKGKIASVLKQQT